MSSFSRKPREGVGAVIGMAGASGTGKTLSALRTARGLAALPGEDLSNPDDLDKIDGRIAFVDTERKRALHYQVAEGEKPQPFKRGHAACFRFAHAELNAPYEPDAYRKLIAEADEGGFAAIIVDSGSHIWEGEGGCHDIHDADQLAAFEEAKRRAGSRNNGNLPSWWNDAEQMDKLNIGAWRRAKMLHKKFVSRLLQCQAHVIVCLRAQDKMRIETVKEEGRNGKEYTKTKITAPGDMAPKDRWQPVCEKNLPFELLTSFVFTPDAPGVPIVLKMHEDHRAFVRDGEVLDERFGQAVAAWARGQKPAKAQPVSAKDFGKTPTPESFDATPPSGRGFPDDDFPGDRAPAGDPYDDAPPADAVWLDADHWFLAKIPAKLPIKEEPTKADWQRWTKAFRLLTERAPSTDVARQWKTENSSQLTKLADASEAAHKSALEFCSAD